MAYFLLFIVLFVILEVRRLNKAKNGGSEKIDITKNADYYSEKYPELNDFPPNAYTYKKEKPPQINITINHNNLHIYPRDEGNQFRQD